MPAVSPISATIAASDCRSASLSSWPTYSGEGVRFAHPSCWAAVHYGETSTFSSSLVDLSNQRTHNPCATTTSASSTVTECGFPISHLRTGGVPVLWSTNAFPGWALDKLPGAIVSIGGHPGREEVTRPGLCGSIGASETIALDVK